MIKDKQEFINRFYVYINQVFGDENVREKILDFFKLPKKALVVKSGTDRDLSSWTHHVAIDLKNNKIICSVEKGHQEIHSDDIACQSYSIYNTIIANKKYILDKIKNRDQIEFVNSLKSLENSHKHKRLNIDGSFNLKRVEIVKNNTDKIVNLFLWLLSQKFIMDEINDLNFERLKDDKKRLIIKEGSGKYITDIIPKLVIVLNDWKDQGYLYFV